MTAETTADSEITDFRSKFAARYFRGDVVNFVRLCVVFEVSALADISCYDCCNYYWCRYFILL